MPLRYLLFLLPILATAREDPPRPNDKAAPHVFAWPFVEWERMIPRGGSTRGAEVTLETKPREAWTNLNKSGLSKLEQDRRAILAMAGDFRVSFDFIETLGFTPDYQPPRPYFSWGTEHVEVLEATDHFISLQHVLVMFFRNEGGQVGEPAVMKHWRQDWTYEPQTIWTYKGNLTWKKEPAPAPAGCWSQAVFQVDDSPRYEVMGSWVHEGGLHAWRSDNCPRPLPRREFSVRSDYNVLEGFHDITLAPSGWLHVQTNRKLQIDDGGKKDYVGTEIGVDRYEAISSPELAVPFRDSWKSTAAYWQEVRKQWDQILRKRDLFTLKSKVRGKNLWQYHFKQAADLENGGSGNLPELDDEIRATLSEFLIEPASTPAGQRGH